ncbi:hypothetical protein LBMAG21_12130 [Armatimonadota bacterium]|nr:hypothetical protein LBMAG21_12130 [Armatimonadota bacterium]
MDAPANLNRRLKRKQDRLNWEEFNLLENLLVFCTQKEYSVPTESRVSFQISGETRDDAICLLFKIDRQPDYLIREQNTLRPDYLALYMDSVECIFTIIEMKGTESHNTRHGIKQIVELKRILAQKFANSFPLGMKARFQGILLCPSTAEIPNPEIRRQRDNGFIILPVTRNYRAELFPYVSKRITKDDSYEHQTPTLKVGHGYLENLLINYALPQRLGKKEASGISLTYVLSDTEYANFVAVNGKYAVSVKQNATSNHITVLKEQLAQFPSLKKIPVQPLTDG